MKIKVESNKEHALIYIEGSLTIENLIMFENCLKEQVDEDRHILLDMKKLDFIDSSSIRFIIQYHSEARNKGRHLCVAATNKEIAEVFSITEIDKMIRVFKTRQEALAFILGS